jgi:hypothetical protein
VRAVNYFIANVKDVEDPMRIGFCDLFYRLRHEILFKVLLAALNFPLQKSDMAFTEFGLDSNRTPDFMGFLTNKKDSTSVLFIIEVSASSSFERAAMSKGLEEAGFESKYKREMDDLDDLGIPYVYLPFIFNMYNPISLEYEEQFGKIAEFTTINIMNRSVLKIIKGSLANITQQFRGYLQLPSAILFSKNIPINRDNDELSFSYKLIKGEASPKTIYSEFCVSSPVYNKITNNWGRLLEIIDYNAKEDRFILYLDSASHKIKVDNSRPLYSKNEYRNVILSNDKMRFFEMLLLKQGNSFIKSTISDSGVKFIDRSNIRRQNYEPTLLPLLLKHESTVYQNDRHFNLNHYIGLLELHFKHNYDSVDFDPLYEDKLFGKIANLDLKNLSGDCYKVDGAEGLMFNKDISKLDIDSEFKELALKQSDLNKVDEKLPVKVIKNKNPFLLPIAEITQNSYCKLNFKNETFYTEVLQSVSNRNPYTSLILEEIIKPDFEFVKEQNMPSSQYSSLRLKKQEFSRDMTKLTKDYYRYFNGKVIEPISKTNLDQFSEPYKNLRDQIRKVDKDIKERSVMEKLSNDIQFIRLPTKSKGSILNQKFRVEMEHYKDKSKQSAITGVGIRESIFDDFSSDKIVFDNISDHLSDHSGLNKNLFFEDIETDDSNLLKELKKSAVKEYNCLINEVKDSFLGHSAALVSNLAHSLLFLSQLPFNSDYIRVDNLGYKDVLLIVKGGKKIFKCRASKMFRLLYPINEALLPWLNTGTGMEGSTEVIKIKDNFYCLTPWRQLHESILNDSISFYTRVVSFSVLNLNPELKFKTQFSKISLNVLLAYHNRRHTETMLANLRYILLATLGDFTGIVEIFKEFMGFNYDCFQSYIRGCILINYPVYFKNLINLKNKKQDVGFKDYLNYKPTHLFSGSRISSEEDLALMIYSTFLMTKAPYQRPAERARNLKGILEIHEYFSKEFSLKGTIEELHSKTNINMDSFDNYEQYVSKLFSNDFYYDSSYCAQLGAFADSYLMNMGLKEEIFNTWINILNKSWDELATSTGLRGRFDDLSNFWGQKGYFVVYKDLISNSKYMDNVSKMMELDLDSDTKRKMLRELNLIYKAKIEDVKDYLIFHAVDKVQWRGGREIYVMDIETKTVQQPIEKFMAYLCQKLDNELISIPSDRRAQVIHHSIFEKDLPMRDTLTWYLTLDCSKWAPKSNFLKFISTFLSMSVLPPTFKTHYLNYTQKLFKKRIYFNEAEVIVLKNNPSYRTIVENHLIFDEVHKGYYLLMPYSWVMGIFNYTSSFLHAINQKYASYIIFKSSLISYGEETKIIMFAHSDDSGGRLTASSGLLISRALFLYEVELKKCNHLLSKKKSVVSKLYFEILSVIYLFKKLLALLPKFLGGLRFLPTDKGPAQDMLQSYSKSIEVMVAGACFNVAYLVMKFYSYMIFRFYYHKRKLNKDLFKLPVQYLGLPDAHPLMVLLCGADSDLVRILYCNGDKYLSNLHCFVENVVSTIEDEGPIKPIKFNIQVRSLKKGFEESLLKYGEIIKKWSISNVNFHSTPFNFFGFLSRLNDPGFVGSLVNESTTRRLSRAYHFRKGNTIPTTLGLINIETMMDCLNIILNYTSGSNYTIKNISEDIHLSLIEGIENNSLNSDKQISFLKEVLSAPIRILKYMDRISIDGRQIKENRRTLKPTHLELIKSSRVFSCKFDPAQMVSFIKEEEFQWALPDIRNLISSKIEVEKLCSDLGFNIDEISPSSLLKLCRTYSGRHTKEIYMYSQVPSEIRQIKTYSSFLTFLSTNSYQNKEISGLVLNLKSQINDPGYVSTNLDEDVYLINNIISLVYTFLKVCDREFILNMGSNPIELLDWSGGDINDLIGHIFHYKSDLQDHVFYNLQISYLHSISKGQLEVNASFIKESAFYLFPKSQKMRGGWYGKGEILIYINKAIYLFSIYNECVVSLISNRKGKLDRDHILFITDVLNNSHITLKASSFRNSSEIKSERMFGIDYNGDFNIGTRREMNRGVPAVFQPYIRTVVDRCDIYRIELIGVNNYLLSTDPEIDPKAWKLHTLPLRKGDLTNVIRMIFDKNKFELLLLTKGLNSFEEFILTEVLTEYGNEAYINPTDFFDSFQSSKIFKILKEIQMKSISKIPNKLENSVVPASEGSLLRLLIDYSNGTCDKIIKVVNNLTPEVMSVRSQFPESVSVILSENLVKCHKSLYSKTEVLEIQRAYENLALIDDEEVLKKSVVQLLTHWGYGSLVNSLENYTLNKDKRNLYYFKLDSCKQLNSSLTSSLFNKLHKIITESMIRMSDISRSLDYPIEKLRNKGGVLSVVYDMNMFVTNTIYGSVILFSHDNIYYLTFLNYLIAFMKDDDFMSDLSENMAKHYIFCSIPLSYQLRREFIALYNTLLYTYNRTNVIRHKLDYTAKVERLGSGIIQPYEFFKLLIPNDMSKDFKYTVNYHNFMNNAMKSFMSSSLHVYASDIDYRVSQEVKRRSKDEVSVGILPLDHVYNPDTFDTEEWDEITATLEMGDAEWEDIVDDFENISNKFIKPKTKKLNTKTPTISTMITWVIDPFVCGDFKALDYYRQSGENLVIVTTELMKDFKKFPNSHVRSVNFTKRLRVSCPDLILYISCSKYLTLEFWDKLVGGTILDLPENYPDILDSSLIILDEGKLGYVSGLGKKFCDDTIDSFVKRMDGADVDSTDLPPNEEVIGEGKEKEKDSDDNKLDKIKMAIEENYANGTISKRLRWRMLEKYTAPDLTRIANLEDLFKNCMNEIRLNNINTSLDKGSLEGLSKDSYVKVFMAPDHFGVSHNTNRSDPRNIKDKKVAAELNSIHSGLATLIGSGTLTISDKFKRLITSNMKMWINITKGTDYKRENKRFLIILFTTIFNSAKSVSTSEDDDLWQDTINLITPYIADDGPDSDDDEEFLKIDVNISAESRLIYKASGF